MNKLIFFSLFLFFCAKVTAQDKITIQSGKSYPENQQGISEFYFVHQTFADAFYMTDLYKQLSDDQMFNILNKVYHSVTANNKVLAIIEQDKGPAARLGFQIFKNTEIGDILVLGTNFNSKKRIFEKEVDPNQSIYRWYAIKKNKLVYRKDLYSKEAEEKARNENAYSLIDMYLFDDNFENDKQVKHLIDELLSNTNDEVDKLYAYLYLGEYWLFNADLKKAEESVEDLEDFFEQSKGIPKRYSLIINMAKTELEMMKRFNSNM